MKSLFQGETMSTKNKLLYAASVAVCFLAGCVIALILRAYDARDAAPVPITGGQTVLPSPCRMATASTIIPPIT